ncbi:MAG: transcription termination factor Rho [Clostridia bacterium]|nr:transcription termination factor Rho [Clostridia bacterium]
MDLETIQKKSIEDLKIIASMLGIEVPEKCTKAKLIKLIAGEEATKAAGGSRKRGRKPSAGKTEKAEKEEPRAAEKPEEPKAAGKPEEPKAADTVKAAEEPAKAEKKPGRRGRPPKNKKAENEAAQDKAGQEKDAPAAETGTGAAEAGEAEGEKTAERNGGTTVKDEDLTGTKKGEFQENSEEVVGLLDVMQEGYGFLRTNKYFNGNKDVFVAPNFIRKYGLRTGDEIAGRSRPQRDNDRYQALFYITSINGKTPDQAQNRVPFESLIPIYPDEQLKLETTQNELSTRLIDLIAPIGKGQRGMIVSPPKAGKTVLLKKIANAITANYPEVKLIVLLIDERPEEVTDMRESIEGEVVSSTFDEMPERHIKVAEMVFERARRLVEFGHDVVILMDSLTRLARAYNITITPTGRSLSGGLDPGAMYSPKKFFGAARNIRGGGSLTIVATALIDTGSKMDDVIFEEFKGTGNMELHLDRKLSEKRVFPAIDINKSGTRKEELLLSEAALNAVFSIRKAIANAGGADVTEMIVSKMLKTQNNEEFIKSVRVGIERPTN